ncbi:class A beta-lactamase [Streptomyces sp. CBMA29]|uniref:class A beta-lactamase n=1 Tax=Streptomyces sp. CBMA29 TaxID=1896314 RepID=UPI001661EFE6|nr:class A beta-lactamase [Streptomyces sp. CBMA29]MBD0740422.1 class A beta-lactamase [Streptomyces sp. CBMA29]
MDTRAPVSRRSALATLAGFAAVPVTGCGGSGTSAPSAPSATNAPSETNAPAAPNAADPATRRAFAELEKRFDATLGVHALDTGSGRTVAHRSDERFAYASTCKALLAGAILEKNSPRRLDRVVRYGRGDIVSNSPITEKHVASGMSVRDLCDAAIRYSDNAAANLLFRELGGPRRLQDALRALGDDVTHCDRVEPALSDAVPGDLRDTSTPRALATGLRAYVLGTALPADKRAVLTDWLVRNTTGDQTIRAGAPRGWRIGDKTGTGGYGTRNDIAIAWPPGGAAPIVLAVLSRRAAKDATRDDALIAKAAEVAFGALA